MTAPFADLRTGGVLRRWLKRSPEDQPIPCQRATYYIGGRQVAYEEWGGDPRLPELLSQDELDFEALRGKAKAPPPPDPERSKVILWWLAASLVTIGVTVASCASASTLQPQYDETGRPFFRAQGPQCWSMKHGGGPIDCALIDSIAEPAPFDVPRWRDGNMETPLETFARTGAYGYGGTPDPSPVPLPAGVWLLLSAVGSLAIWRKL